MLEELRGGGQQEWEAEAHACLLASLLLGFDLDAYVVVGAVRASRPPPIVRTSAPLPSNALCLATPPPLHH